MFPPIFVWGGTVNFTGVLVSKNILVTLRNHQLVTINHTGGVDDEQSCGQVFFAFHDGKSWLKVVHHR